MKKKGREKLFKCTICGKFIAYKDIEDDKVNIVFTPDSEYTIEETLMTHEKCYKEFMENKSNN